MIRNTILSIVLLTTSIFGNVEYNKIVVYTSLGKIHADVVVKKFSDEMTSENEIKELQKQYGFHFVSRPSGKYHIVSIEPFDDKKILEKVYISAHKYYPDAFINRLDNNQTKPITRIVPKIFTYKNHVNTFIPSNFSDTFRRFLINGVLLFLSMSLLAIITITLHKIIIEIRTKKIEKYKTRYRSEITELLFNPNTQDLSPIYSSLEFTAASDIVIELIDTFSDPIYTKILHTYLDTYNIRKHYTRIASNTHSSQRLDAVERLAIFRYDENRLLFIALLSNSKNSYHIRIAALIGLSYIFSQDDQEIFLSTIKSIDTSGKFSEFLFFNAIEHLLESNSEHTIHSLYESLLTDTDQFSLKSFIEAIADTEYNQFASRLRDLYFSTQRFDLKISIIRALGILTDHQTDCSMFLDALKSENTTLRIVASKSIAICLCDTIAIPASKALYDQSYRVRYNLARSLLTLPNGIQQLKYVANDSSDKYAAQSALYALKLLESSHA